MDSRVGFDAPPARAGRPWRALAVVVVTVVLGCVGAGTWLYLQAADDSPVLLGLYLGETLLAAAVGLLIVRRHSRHPVGWLLLLHALLTAVVLGGDGYAEYGGVLHPGSLPGPGWAALVGDAGWPLLYLCLALIGYVFPAGRFLSRRWRRFVVGALAANALFLVAAAYSTKSFSGSIAAVPPPLPALTGAVVGAASVIGLIGVAATLIGAVVCARSRLHHAVGEQRVQLLWFVWAALSIPVALAVCLVDARITGSAGTLTMAAVTVFGSVIPLAVGVAILRTRLFDIELVLSRTLTYGALTLLVIATYAAALFGIGALVDSSSAGGLVAVGIVAVAIQPVHVRVRRWVDRWVYGDRSDPYAALRRLSDRLEQTLDSAQVVATVTSSVAEALRVPDVRVVLGSQPETAAGTGTLPPGPASVARVPLAYQGDQLGELVIDLPPGRVLNAADRAMLDDLARHAGIAVNAVHLTLDLQRSRAELVTAQAEERRRLRRDLHDGLGPSLAAIVLKLNAVGATVRDPVAGQMLAEVRTEAKAAIAEIRRLVDDLRPPALDEVGLLAALRQKAVSLSGCSGMSSSRPLVVEVEGPGGVPALPAAVEVAAYRIATEAMTNVARHAAATRCLVTLSMNGAVEVSVADDGRGTATGVRPGVGWTSMRERAAELGGSCTISRRAGGGTLVRAVLPMPDPPAQRPSAPVSEVLHRMPS